jgi:hypothetical protein
MTAFASNLQRHASNLKRSDPPSSNDAKPLASLSLDLDNLWSYLKIHGDAGWEKYPSYLDILIPYVLDIFDQFKLRITFFVVGKDVSSQKNIDFLRSISKRGHEVGNHSFHHDPWLHLYSRDRIEWEISQTEDHIFQLTGQRPLGFRGPGFSWSKDTLEVLLEKGYLYDASTMPTCLGPVARAYYFRNRNVSEEQKRRQKEILGGFREGLGPLRPYYWKLPSGGKLLEIPVTTTPIIKTPFHMSYLLFLGRFSVFIMLLYLKIALAACEFRRIEPSFIIHPTDLLGGEQVPHMHFFPGMDLSANRKLELFNKVIKILSEHFTLVDMLTHAESILKRTDIAERYAS